MSYISIDNLDKGIVQKIQVIEELQQITEETATRVELAKTSFYDGAGVLVVSPKIFIGTTAVGDNGVWSIDLSLIHI